MSDSAKTNPLQDSIEAALCALRSQEARLTALEAPPKKSILKSLSENASLTALFLGLVLSFGSLRDTFIVKPETDRISRVSQFNSAVNAAAKARQELLQTQAQTPNQGLQLALMSAATPQILNDVSTAKAILRYLDNSDVGVPQLLILTYEAFTAGDIEGAREFVERAVSKTDVSPYQQSEAKRYQGRYYFATGNPVAGRNAFETAIRVLGDVPLTAAARAYVMMDFVVVEFGFGDCKIATVELNKFADLLTSPAIPIQSRNQLGRGLKDQLLQLGWGHCPSPDGFDKLVPF
jgi:hypothetical protein